MAATAKTYLIDKAPKRIRLHGDKTTKPESAQHIIEFPGGSIELSRTTDGHYWAHIAVNKGQVLDDCDGFNGKQGEVISARLDTENAVLSLDDPKRIQHLAVLIRTT